MIDLLLYLALAVGMAWVGWEDRDRTFDYAHAERISQEGTESGTHN